MENKEKPATKDKRRNNEKRKEKSRDAARSRRSKETEVFTDLGSALPIPQDQVSQLDKASVMRLAIAYLRVRDMVSLVREVPEAEDHKILAADESLFLKSLEGFLLVMSADGDIVYTSENVSDYLGITQIDLMGQNVYEYSHPCDHDEIKEILSGKTREDAEGPKSFFIRLKCTLTSKGRSVNLKSATYKVIHCIGHLVQDSNDKEEASKGNMHKCLVAVGQPIPHPSNIEAPLPKQTFLTKHSLDMKFTHADDKIMKEVLGYDSEDLVGKSVYEYHHALDSDSIYSAFKCLFSKGQCETYRYRFLAKTGGYVWVLTQATLIYDIKMLKPQSVVCVNYVISGVECKDEIYSSSQLATVKAEKVFNINISCKKEALLPDIVVEKVADETSPTVKSNLLAKTKSNDKILLSPYIETNSPRLPLTSTSKIFAPRTEEMNKGFLTFSDDEPGLTMLKDEPDDLTHLAPVAGDVCVPLDDHPFLTDMMLDDILLRDNFGPLLTDEPADPFISYRDSFDNSPQLLSPNLSKNSECSLPSLNSPSDSLSDEDRMSTFMNLQMDDEPELMSKAPYIPMNVGDDLPLLIQNDLMWNSNGRSKNSADSSSSLAQLLCSSLNKHVRTNDHGGGLIQDEQSLADCYNKKNSPILRKSTMSLKSERNKRSNTSSFDTNTNKRSRNNEPKEKMSSELLQQLMSNNHHRGRPKGKSNWLIDSGGQKAACISQPSDSVLMNLLDVEMADSTSTPLGQNDRLHMKPPEDPILTRQKIIRKNSISLLDPEATIPSLLDLTQQDFEVNAPVNSLLLQGTDLLTALDINGTM